MISLSIIFVSAICYFVYSLVRMRKKRANASKWNLTTATIESVELVARGHYAKVYDADVSYSYCVKESQFGGVVSVPFTWWTREPSSELVSKTIDVRVSPANPRESVVVSATLPGIDKSVAPELLIQGANR